MPTRPYFAYGMNQDLAEMRERCPDAVCHGVADLADHRFQIHRRGVATVVPVAGSVVCGVLWTLGQTDEQALDRFEGVRAGFYRKLIVTVGRAKVALIYVATDEVPGQPRPGCLEAVIAAGRSHGLPDGYVAELLQWRTR